MDGSRKPSKERVIATRRTTSAKRDRERAKQARAASKRERRAERSTGEEDVDEAGFVDDGVTAADVMQRLKDLHEQYDNEQIDFDAFDEEKNRLLDRLAAGFPDD
jgi:hypothetical protein